VSGAPGTGKTSLAAAFVRAACARGERAVYFAMEESPQQIMRNMKSIGIDLEPFIRKGLLRFHASRPTSYGLEMHLLAIHETTGQLKPQVIVFDPISNLLAVGESIEVVSMLTRLIDYFKVGRITGLFTSLVEGETGIDKSEAGVSSLMDAWIRLTNVTKSNEQLRSLYVIKSRGMASSNKV